jgi:DNA oxidative demethylase
VVGQLSLFAGPPAPPVIPEGLGYFAGLALPREAELLADLEAIVAAAPFRQMVTPGGRRMSAAMTNCGALGWITDARGYRYTTTDPLTGHLWPAMPRSIRELAIAAAESASYLAFDPDACLVNCYAPGAQMTLHQDRNERDFDAPIVSVSLGLPATFLFGGHARSDRPEKVPLIHGDVLVWGGPSRLRFHGVLPIQEGEHPRLGAKRINLTIRKAG